MHADILREALTRKDLPLGPTSWYYLNIVPKGIVENLKYRQKISRMLKQRPSFIADLQCICKRDILFEINTFGWTHSPKDHTAAPVQPFITWPYQDLAIPAIREAIGVEGGNEPTDASAPKSRDMGATWQFLVTIEHAWRYFPGLNFLCASRKKELVVNPGNMKALLSKLHWYTTHLPHWLRPESWKPVWGDALIVNESNDSIIAGEATVKKLGVGDRLTAIFLDEFGLMPDALEIMNRARDATNCILYNSTPNGRMGPGEAYFKTVTNQDIPKIWMHWSDHPYKRRGLYYYDEHMRKRRFPRGWKWQDSYDFKALTFKPHMKPRSLWYDKQVKRSGGNLRWIAQELDLNFNHAGRQVFDEAQIAMLMEKYARPPLQYGRLEIDADLTPTWYGKELLADSDFLLWIDEGLVAKKEGDRLNYYPPEGEYSIGADIATGSGGENASPSSLVITNVKTRKQVGRFTTRSKRPGDHGRYAVGVAMWFHNAKITHEANSSFGKQFMDAVKACRYFNVYERKQKDVIYDEYTGKFGYANQDGGRELLVNLERAMFSGMIEVRDEMIYREMAQYIEGPNGTIMHGGVRSRDIDGENQKTHGDVAIGGGLSYEGYREQANWETAESKETDDDGVPQEILPCDKEYWARYRERVHTLRSDREENVFV